MPYSLLMHFAASCAAVGFAMMAFSLFSRAHRGVSDGGGFWARKESFTPTEYAANRAGFLMSLFALLLLLAKIVLR
ncbi:hypothetical protein N790_09340 [Arenimonas malthae CC-JY-1]|uniref:Uncharacterized protein n=1 Tax=Arenimonas malthae CC-JY-1 TaxID=1384054 RepID=A0A091B4E6_9GAMM|nr:hypothetical protein [Arenimonas malthae]KFN45759.1 hypothetical protein N790_09340 [Arenimonas malthae CC-JY-1]